jgi:hypothetical protein
MTNGDGGSGPSLVTTTSILTYSGATGAVTVVWTFLKQVDVTNRWVAVGLAFITALVIQFLSESLPARVKPRVARWLVYGFLILVNTAILASAQLGINEAINP